MVEAKHKEAENMKLWAQAVTIFRKWKQSQEKELGKVDRFSDLSSQKYSYILNQFYFLSTTVSMVCLKNHFNP